MRIFIAQEISHMRTTVWGLALLCLSAPGCGGAAVEQQAVPLDALPAGSLEAAKKRLPGYTFERARKSTYEGKAAFEIIGKNKRGKTREVEVSETGEILEVE